MSLFRRGKIWYGNYTTPSGKRIKESLGTEDKKLAQELHDTRKVELWRIERLGDFPDVTFEEAIVRWIEEKADKKSLDDDKGRLSFWLDHFEGYRLKDITEAKIYSVINKMVNRKARERWEKQAESAKRKGKEIPAFTDVPVSNATKAKHLAIMKSLLRAAERDWKWLEKSPVIKVPTIREKRVRWLEHHEAKRLIQECPEPLKSVVTFALATGLRRSNIINLEWSQIDMQRKVAWINPEDSKSGQAIGVALNDTACQVLKEQIGNHHKWVFVHTEPKKRPDGTLTPSVRKMRVDSNTAWRAALKRAGIENFRFHDLRHTWASWLIQSGVPLSVLQEMGGWESVDMVRRYAHLAPNHLTEHAKQIDSIFGSCVPNTSHLRKVENLK
ncbi:tyrosine-type recombinase/integrase [Proteus mirabilis]|uniref:tyrosine-type recombinase/integrase n=1 Tax=Proteus mirabilis TaxID=584 RepID=UPI00137776B6|nr:site-specific integrase [Proteus mirabilis]NBC76583.1 tyrosine-type recombinase/integrase [Proteus mirabilis]HEK2033471.1 site-specific integrase [Proteus mirabilis]